MIRNFEQRSILAEFMKRHWGTRAYTKAQTLISGSWNLWREVETELLQDPKRFRAVVMAIPGEEAKNHEHALYRYIQADVPARLTAFFAVYTFTKRP